MKNYIKIITLLSFFLLIVSCSKDDDAIFEDQIDNQSGGSSPSNTNNIEQLLIGNWKADKVGMGITSSSVTYSAYDHEIGCDKDGCVFLNENNTQKVSYFTFEKDQAGNCIESLEEGTWSYIGNQKIKVIKTRADSTIEESIFKVLDISENRLELETTVVVSGQNLILKTLFVK